MIRPIDVLQLQFAIISYLTERNIIKVNYHLGMKDMLRDMIQDHAISEIIVCVRCHAIKNKIKKLFNGQSQKLVIL